MLRLMRASKNIFLELHAAAWSTIYLSHILYGAQNALHTGQAPPCTVGMYTTIRGFLYGNYVDVIPVKKSPELKPKFEKILAIQPPNTTTTSKQIL